MKRAATLCGCILLAAGIAFWVLGLPAYRAYKERRAIARAGQYLAAGDYRNASLSTRQALALNPRDLEACQFMAQIAEVAHAPQVLDWRRRVVELAPTLENKLHLAATALLVERPPCALAAQTLDELGPVATNSVAYHMVAAQLALKLNSIPTAEAHFRSAAELEPSNQLHQLNLAVLRLASTNQAWSAAARATLERLTANTNLAPIALQWLVNDCLVHGDSVTAKRLSDRLLSDPRAGLEDRLRHITILSQVSRPEFGAFLVSVQTQALTNPAAIHAVATWMINHELAANALFWLTNLPVSLQAEQPVPLAMVDCYLALKDWPGLRSRLGNQKWGDFEFIRLAAMSRAEQQQQDDVAANAHWRLAIREAGNHFGPLTALLTLAGAWGFEKQREELLWQMLDQFPQEHWNVRELERLYSAAGNTRALNKLYGAVASRNGKDFVAKNNFAATSMLLGTGLPKAHATAKEIYAAHPTEPIVVSTYAWSLQLQGQTRNGLVALEKLRPEALETPAVALYYGLLLSAANEPQRAARYLALVNPALLLPEEKALLAAAQKD